jgi:hypothetical protein
MNIRIAESPSVGYLLRRRATGAKAHKIHDGANWRTIVRHFFRLSFVGGTGSTNQMKPSGVQIRINL